MKWYSILFFSLFFGDAIRACQPADDPFAAFTLDEDAQMETKKKAKEAYLARLRFAFNEEFPCYQNTEFEERVKAIEDVNHPLRKKYRYLADAYVVLKLEDDEVNAVGMISSQRQLVQVLGLNYNYRLRNIPHILINHFKVLPLEDGELVDLGALLLGTNDYRIMLEVMQHDLKNDHAEMKKKANKGKIDGNK